ncbi:hypothetical protein [Leucobacter manosquensis]|uniref:YCII-related domain-containing protein n=1 Tax=Leucobacter manosquensis TaxID=2810611 RepID=A0ABS5M2W7_9MICO|nr:hypothetical protein [Leucobacter manosquensis]MBS3181170.1 hypothetical protein [Leucobacter manosquensis]
MTSTQSSENEVWILTLDGDPVIGVFDSRKAADAAADLYTSTCQGTEVNYTAYTMNVLVGSWPNGE